MAGGSARYSLAGNSYTERIDYFFDPSVLGKDFKATCRTEGDRWFHSHSASEAGDTATGAAGITVVEEWRRIK